MDIDLSQANGDQGILSFTWLKGKWCFLQKVEEIQVTEALFEMKYFWGLSAKFFRFGFLWTLTFIDFPFVIIQQFIYNCLVLQWNHFNIDTKGLVLSV